MVRSKFLLLLGLILIVCGLLIGLWTLKKSGSAYDGGVLFVYGRRACWNA